MIIDKLELISINSYPIWGAVDTVPIRLNFIDRPIHLILILTLLYNAINVSNVVLLL